MASASHPLLSIGDDLLGLIVARTNSHAALAAAARTCHRLRTIIEAPFSPAWLLSPHLAGNHLDWVHGDITARTAGTSPQNKPVLAIDRAALLHAVDEVVHELTPDRRSVPVEQQERLIPSGTDSHARKES